jgi:hypothetical protein
MARHANKIEGISPHPVPLPMGEGTPCRQLRPDSLSHGEMGGALRASVALEAAARGRSDGWM